MCGLVGAVAGRNVVPVLLDGLKRLEYRGYDSAGLAYLDGAGAVGVHRCVGRVAALEQSVAGAGMASALGIGHTRWATHGEPEERNAHPHISHGEVAVVHNGIIENFEALRRQLQEQGYEFRSDTDTEVIVHLVHRRLQSGASLFEAVQAAVRELSGAYAIAVMAASEPYALVVARRDSPLVIGIGDGELFAASDAAALARVAQRFVFPQDGDVALLTRDAVRIADAGGGQVQRAPRRLALSGDAVEKGSYRHYMLKEIHEQPHALADTLQGRVTRGAVVSASLGFKTPDLAERIRSVQIVACGTSHHAGEVARYWLESLARVPCSIDLASEYRYRSPVVPPDCLFATISQSGETADTLAALRYARDAGYLATLGICNAPESSLARESDMTLLTRAGPEIGVASTKAFTTQLLSLLMLTVLLARRGWDDVRKEAAIVRQMTRVAGLIEEVLHREERIAEVAQRFADRHHALFLGRGPLYPIAREGALKLKEISYIHAEAYAAGELKHGPLALVDRDMPVIALAPHNGWLDKLKSNLREVRARGGELFVFADAAAGVEAGAGTTVIQMPAVDELIAPIVYTVALQLLAYHVAVIKGTDVDKPRNLAKSVTVE